MEEKILDSWRANADEWINSIESGNIKSREITSPAIINTLIEYQPTKLLDIGCGEGWLTEEMIANGVDTEGMDGTLALVMKARSKRKAIYYDISYQDLIDNPSQLKGRNYSAAVFNFSLYEKEIVPLLKSVKSLLPQGGYIFIQTLHPDVFFGPDYRGKGRWESDSWKGLAGNFVLPHNWYSRSFSDWEDDFQLSDLKLTEKREVHKDGVALSVIFILS